MTPLVEIGGLNIRFTGERTVCAVNEHPGLIAGPSGIRKVLRRSPCYTSPRWGEAQKAMVRKSATRPDRGRPIVRPGKLRLPAWADGD